MGIVLAAIIAISLFVVLPAAISQTASAATISVEPSYLNVTPGEEFSVNITVYPGGAEIYGAQYTLHFDNILLRALSQNKGPFLTQDGAGYIVIKNNWDNTVGKTDYGEMRKGVDYGVTEPGVLATIDFEVRSSGVSELCFGEVILSDPNGSEILNVTVNNGTVETTGAQPLSPFLVYGYVFYENGSECSNPHVKITNLNTGVAWQAETSPTSNYYQFVLCYDIDITAGEVLQFEVTSPYGCQLNITNYTITPDDIANGGLFNFNITLESPEKPDLVITDAWVCWPENCTICYTIMNIGYGIAPAGHNTTLYVDGVEKAHDEVPVVLVTGDNYTGCFEGYSWLYTSPEDNITVCADNNGTVTESEEGNNCWTKKWKCGDVSGDGWILTDDGDLVYYVAGGVIDIGSLTNDWAADVSGDGWILTDDGDLVYYVAGGVISESNLNCKCMG